MEPVTQIPTLYMAKQSEKKLGIYIHMYITYCVNFIIINSFFKAAAQPSYRFPCSPATLCSMYRQIIPLDLNLNQHLEKGMSKKTHGAA